MFSLTDRATSTLLSREVNETIDENVLKLFVQKNKYQSEFTFLRMIWFVPGVPKGNQIILAVKYFMCCLKKEKY